MGCMESKPDYIIAPDGDERNYQDRFLEAETLGQGEFGVVKLVHDVKNKNSVGSRPLAVKYLRKGFQFKDNTLYSPIKKEVLQGEVEILRRLSGDCYCLKVRHFRPNLDSFLVMPNFSSNRTLNQHIIIFHSPACCRL